MPKDNTTPLASKTQRDASELGDRFQSLTKDAREIAHNTGASAREALHTASERLHTAYDRTRSEVSDFADEFSATVRQRPIQSSLVALGVGYLVGRLLSK